MSVRRNLTQAPVCKLLVAGLLAVVCMVPAASHAQPASTDTPADDFSAQRELYRSARDALAQQRLPEFRSILAALEHYPLLPYLEYAELSPRLASMPETEVERFLQRYPDSYLGAKLERQWVETLAKQQRWADVLRYYNPANTTTELTCNAFRAHLETGDTSILADVAPLWNVPRSQANVCDPVFAAWTAAGYLTPALAWQRFASSLKANQKALTRYLATQLPPREQTLAATWMQVDSKPALLRNADTFSTYSPEMQEIVVYGLQRLAQSDALEAMALLQTYQPLQNLSDEQYLSLRRYISLRMLLQGHIDETEALLAATPDLRSETLVEWILRDALKQQDWSRVESWLALLPETARTSERWQYWQARILASKGTAATTAAAQSIYQTLAQNRSFYGFLAADLLGLPYALVDKPLVVSTEALTAVASLPAIVRARELYLSGEEPDARSEWQHANALMPPEQVIAAGKLADSWGWYRNGIQAMIKVSYWDDLQLRFPLAYSDAFATAANDNAIAQQLLFAIARQESAFMQDVRSSAGAMGLMQLIPSTAQETAAVAGMKISTNDLLQPDINITLGSRYLSRLLQQFNGNRILATAAYNAGPNRVQQWLNAGSSQPLPPDIWIETIPFGETRGYVQNVMAYAVIYGYRMGLTTAFLTSEEAGSTL